MMQYFSSSDCVSTSCRLCTTCSTEWQDIHVYILLSLSWIGAPVAYSLKKNTQHSYVYTWVVQLLIVSRGGSTTCTISAASSSSPMPDTLQARKKIIDRARCLWEHDQGQQLIDHDCATKVFTVGRNENHDRAYTVHIEITEIPNNLESCIKRNNMVFLISDRRVGNTYFRALMVRRPALRFAILANACCERSKLFWWHPGHKSTTFTLTVGLPVHGLLPPEAAPLHVMS
jgi:hypothetical protein